MTRRIAAAIALAAALPLLAQLEQTTPPAPAGPRQANVPQPAEKTLKNGLRVIVVEKRGLPLAAVRLMMKTGGEADPQGLPGVADMTASLLTKGTKTRSAEQIARGVEALGATIESGGGWDNSTVDLTTLSTNFGAAMTYVADVAINPAFAKEEIDRLRAQNLDALSVAMREPASLAGFVVPRVLYPGQPYGHNAGGTPASLAKIGRAEITQFHRRHYRPENAVLVVAGDVPAAEAFSIAETLFGGWKNPPAATGAEEKPAEAADAKPRVVVIDIPDAGQAAVLVARRGIRRSDPAFVTSQVTNMILGGDFSSRLNQEVRIKRGLSYGAGSSFDARRGVGPFVASAQTKNESAGEVAAIMTEEIARLASTTVPEAELVPRKANLIGRFGRAIETSAGLVGRIGGLALYGLPPSDISRYVSDVQGVTSEAVQKFSASAFAGAPDIVIAGDAKKFGESFRQKYPNAEIIPIEQLDLDSATLRKK